MNKSDQSGIVKSVQKGLKILKFIMDSEAEVSIHEIEAEYGYNASTIHHQLKTLMEEGFVSQNLCNKKYGIGSELFFYSLIHRESDSYLSRIDPILKECCDQTGETTNLFVSKNNEAICIRGYESPKILRANLQIGRRIPLHSTAAGKVFLTYNCEEILTNMEEKYNQYKEQGFTTEVNEFEDMISAVAVPVYSPEGTLIFSLSTIIPTSRVEENTLEQIGSVLKEVSRKITKTI